jgi:hypothetical protein
MSFNKIIKIFIIYLYNELPGIKKDKIKLQIIEGTTLEICGN